MADRALAPVVGKAMEAALVVLFLGLLTTTLYGGVVPDYRDAAGREVAERTLSLSAQRVQQSVPPANTAVSASYRVDLPRTIRGRAYSVETNGRQLMLSHPSPAVEGETPLVLPDTVQRVSGSWSSRGRPVVRVTTTEDGLTVRLAS